MKILHLTTDSNLGGCEQLLLAAQERGFEPGVEHVYCTLFDRGTFHREIERRGGLAYSLNCRRATQGFKALRRLLSLLRAIKPDILHTHLYHAGVLARVASLFGKTPPRVHTRHYASSLYQFGAKWDPSIDAWATRGAQRVVAISNSVRTILSDVEGIPEGRVHLIYNGISLDKVLQRPRPAGETFELIAVGSLHPRKGHVYLIRAMTRVREAFPTVRLRILGEGRERARLEHLIQQLNLQNVIELSGFAMDVAGTLATADLFVQPSLEEGFGISILEAMAQELPVVASRVGGIPEIVEEEVTGRLVPPGDEEALASEIIALLRDPSQRRSMGIAGRRRFVEHFTLDAMIENYRSLYQGLLVEVSSAPFAAKQMPTAFDNLPSSPTDLIVS